MIRRLVLSTLLCLAGAAPALAQTHSPPHPRAHPHGPGHVRPDSAHHAALHALFHGSWKGTFTPARSGSSGLDLTIAHDSVLKLTLRMGPDEPVRAGAGTDFVMKGNQLHWTQDLSGTACQATAVLTPATPLVPDTMKGTLACEDGDITFTLRKQTR